MEKWNESGFRPPLCTYRLNWARRTSWGWWDDWDDTVLQTQDPKFEPWRSEAEHATSRSRRLPTILTFTRGCGRNNFVSLKPPRPGTEPRTLAWKAAVLTTTPGPPPARWRRNSNTRKQTHRSPWFDKNISKRKCGTLSQRWYHIELTLWQRLVGCRIKLNSTDCLVLKWAVTANCLCRPFRMQYVLWVVSVIQTTSHLTAIIVWRCLDGTDILRVWRVAMQVRQPASTPISHGMQANRSSAYTTQHAMINHAANTRRWTNADLMLGKRHRREASVTG